MYTKILFLGLGLSFILPTTYAQRRLGRKHISEALDCHGECARILWQNLRRDIRFCRVHPQNVQNLDNLWYNYRTDEKTNIRGAMMYREIMPGPYRYQVELGADNTVHITAKVFLRGIHRRYSPEEIEDLKLRFSEAEKIWEASNPYPFRINFHFELAETRNMSVRARVLRKKHRGPYFLRWSYAWSPQIIAHEFGHVLGLDDEYSKIRNVECYQNSLMCSSGSGEPLPFHYYLILRRAICHL